MACNFYCPECGENLGKDTEVPKLTDCGTCGATDLYNERGDEDCLDDEDLEKIREIKRRRKQKQAGKFITTRTYRGSTYGRC